MSTLAEQLTSVQEAIAAIESGAQSVIEEGHTVQRPSLESLYRRERDLLARIEQESSGRLKIYEM